jgi:hypothetical protein
MIDCDEKVVVVGEVLKTGVDCMLCVESFEDKLS